MCRWGILSTAGIARKNWHSIVNSGNGRITAVASRSADKAQAFIDECRASVPVSNSIAAVGSYDELLNRNDVDAVYVPLPTGLRTEWVVRAANAGKHVMVEKPCGVSAEDVRKMISACEANKVQFMDGVMFMHSERLPEMRRTIDDGRSIGKLRRIASAFTFCAADDWFTTNIRASSSLEPAGCLGDLGWYTIRLTLWAMKYQMPIEVRGRILEGLKRTDSPEAVPVEFEGEMHFADGVSATFFNSFRCNHQQWANIGGSQGYLALSDFVLPFFGNESAFEVGNHQLVQDGCRYNLQRYSRRAAVPEISNNAPSAQESRLFRTFGELVLKGQPDPFWPEITLKTQLVMDAALTSAQNGSKPVQLATV